MTETPTYENEQEAKSWLAERRKALPRFLWDFDQRSVEMGFAYALARLSPTEDDREAARDWYATNPPEVKTCPEMYAGDAMDIYSAGRASTRAPEPPTDADLTTELAECTGTILAAVASGEISEPLASKLRHRLDHFTEVLSALEDTDHE